MPNLALVERKRITVPCGAAFLTVFIRESSDLTREVGGLEIALVYNKLTRQV
jgi:hypothetical protein